MNTTTKIVRYELRDVLRSRALIVYALFFFGLTDVLLRFGGGGARAALSLMTRRLQASVDHRRGPGRLVRIDADHDSIGHSHADLLRLGERSP